MTPMSERAICTSARGRPLADGWPHLIGSARMSRLVLIVVVVLPIAGGGYDVGGA